MPARTSSTHSRPVPQNAAPPSPPQVVQHQQPPGMLKQMAATAGGVAIGSAVVSYA